MSAAVIEVEQVSMHYGPVRAVQDVSFEVKPGQVFGLSLSWRFGDTGAAAGATR